MSDAVEGCPHLTEDGRPYTCRECGKPMLKGQASHGASWNDEKAQGMHWDCHVPFEDALRGLRDTLKKAEDQLDKVKRIIR